MNRPTLSWLCLLPIVACACSRAAPPSLYEKVPVSKRDLEVVVSAAGLVEPLLTVDVKSKASGEIVEMLVQTGSDVRAGQLLARIDPRPQRNALALAEANLDVARAQLKNAQAQQRRADELYANKMIAETEFETTNLALATAKAAVIRAETDLENARDQMRDTEIRAPMGGTVLQKNVELGTVISSPTRDVGGGTVLFRMANLDTMQVRALVDETDIGKVQAGPIATVRVDAYTNRTFRGRVLKIEPQAIVQQNVTMFPVLVGIENVEHLLHPGMNGEVELDAGRRSNVITIPNAALRTQRDVASAAQVLGLDPDAVQTQLAGGGGRDTNAGGTAQAAPGPTAASADSARTAAAPPGETITLPNGTTVALPPGITAEQVRAAMAKRMSGQEPTPAERAMLRQVFAGSRGGMGGGGGGGGRRRGDSANKYIVFTLQAGRPTPIEIETGLTNLDYIEVTSGLAEGDTVLLLPSASLLQQQKEFRERFQRMSGGGLPGVQQQQQQQPSSGQRSQGR